MSAPPRDRAPWVRLVREAGKPYGLGLDVLVTTPKGAASVLREVVAEEEVEVCAVVYLDARAQPLGRHVLSRGTAVASLVHPREVFRPAIAFGASSLILAHNHPSGNLKPSTDDLAIFSRLKAAGELLGIHVLDMLVLAPGTEAVWSCAQGGVDA